MNTSTIIALAAAALAATTALSTAAEARGFGGGMRGFGGGMRAAPMRMNSFKPAASFKSFRPASAFKSKPSFVKREFKPARSFVHKAPKVFKPSKAQHKITRHIRSEPKVTKHIKPVHKLPKQIAKHDIKPRPGQALKQLKMAKQINALKSFKKGPLANKTLAKMKANKLFGNKLLGNKLAGNKMFGNKMFGNKVGMLKSKPLFTKLNPSLKLKAMHFDLAGKKFSPVKKAWWDGKHWWFGAAALSWVFVDGYWYYGDEHVYWENDAWRTDSGFVAECLDCETEYVTRTRVASVGTAGPDVTPAQTVTRTSTQGQSSDEQTASAKARRSGDEQKTSGPATSSDKPVKTAVEDAKTKTTTPMSTEAVLIKSDTTGFTEQTSEIPVEPTTATQEIVDPVAETTGAALTTRVAEATVEPVANTDATVSPEAGEPAASPVIDCKRFVPAVGMTVSVPCGK